MPPLRLDRPAPAPVNDNGLARDDWAYIALLLLMLAGTPVIALAFAGGLGW